MTSSFTRLASVTASTKRAAVSSGKRAAPSENIASLSCTPLDPASEEIRQRFGLNTPHDLLQTFTEGGLDIVEGDVLVVGSTEYPIKAVSPWTFGGSSYKHIIVEELKR